MSQSGPAFFTIALYQGTTGQACCSHDSMNHQDFSLGKVCEEEKDKNRKGKLWSY